MSTYIYTILLLICSNTFMTFAWYAHLKDHHHKALWAAILISWSIAFFEYLFQVPANRIGYYSGQISLAQLKILQEVISLCVFMPFAIFYMHQEMNWNFVWGQYVYSWCCLFYFQISFVAFLQSG